MATVKAPSDFAPIAMSAQDRAEDEAEPRPDLFFMYQDGRWFIAFFAPGQGKQMTALGYFNSGT